MGEKVNFQKPLTKGNLNDARYHAIKLAKLGYYQGNPSIILIQNLDIILDIICYETFENNYNYMMHKLNAPVQAPVQKKENNKK